MTTILSVDVQEEYNKFIYFDMNDYINYLLKQIEAGNKVILFYNSFGEYESDRINFMRFLEEYLYDYHNQTIEYSNDEDKSELVYEQLEKEIDYFFDNVTLAPKTYAYFRTEATDDKEQLATLIGKMLTDKVVSLDEYNDEQVEDLEEFAQQIVYTGEFFGFNDGVSSVLEQIADNVILIGGSDTACLAEVEVELLARQIPFEKNYNFIY